MQRTCIIFFNENNWNLNIVLPQTPKLPIVGRKPTGMPLPGHALPIDIVARKEARVKTKREGAWLEMGPIPGVLPSPAQRESAHGRCD